MWASGLQKKRVPPRKPTLRTTNKKKSADFFPPLPLPRPFLNSIWMDAWIAILYRKTRYSRAGPFFKQHLNCIFTGSNQVQKSSLIKSTGFCNTKLQFKRPFKSCSKMAWVGVGVEKSLPKIRRVLRRASGHMSMLHSLRSVDQQGFAATAAPTWKW